MSELTLRRATLEDLEVVQRFQQGIVEAERPYDPTLKSGPIEYYDLKALLGSAQVCLLLAEVSGVAVGCGFARIDAAKPFVVHEREAYLGLMYVAPAFRGRGINGRLLAGLRQWCTAQHIEELRLEVYPGNASAIAAYEKAGFAPLMLAMRLRLTP